MYQGYILSVARLADRLDGERVIEKNETPEYIVMSSFFDRKIIE